MGNFWLVRRELLRHHLLVVRQHAYLPHGAFGTQVPLLRGVEGVRVQEIYRKAQDAENDEFNHFFRLGKKTACPFNAEKKLGINK